MLLTQQVFLRVNRIDPRSHTNGKTDSHEMDDLAIEPELFDHVAVFPHSTDFSHGLYRVSLLTSRRCVVLMPLMTLRYRSGSCIDPLRWWCDHETVDAMRRVKLNG